MPSQTGSTVFSSRLAAKTAVGNERGQATVEFAIATAAVLVAVIAGSAAYRAFDQGILVQHAVCSASRHVQGDVVGAMADIFVN